MKICLAPLLFLLLTVPGLAQVTATPDLDRLGSLDVAAVIKSIYPRTLALLEHEFPDEHTELLRQLEASDEAEGEDSARLTLGFELMTELRRRYADRLAFAPGVNHSIMLGRLADFYDAVFDAEGSSVCGRFAHDGSAILFELGLAEKYAGALDLQSLAYFEAVVRSIEEPEIHEPVQPADWSAVLGIMVSAGAPQSYVETIAGGRPNDPDLCPAMAAVFRTSGLLDSPAGARTRADFAKNLAGY